MQGQLAAIVLAGGRGRRLGGVDKAALPVPGGTLLDRVLHAVAGCEPVVVVGPPSVTDGRPGLRRVQEEPAYGGPAAGLLTALATLADDPAYVVVVAVDLPGLTPDTVARLRVAATGDGAVLIDEGGRRQPVLMVRVDRLRAAAPGPEVWPGLSLRWLLEPLSLIEVAAVDDEASDVDTSEDLSRLTHGRDLG